MVKQKTIDFLEELNKKYSDYLKKDDEVNVQAISTGALSLDVSIGVGGIPLRRFTEIYGSESTGKTALALNISKHAILDNNLCVLYIDPEQAVTVERINQIVGFYDPDSFKLIQPETMEQSLEVAELGIKSGEFGLIILDSIGSMAPLKVKEDNLGDTNVALLARMMTTWVQRNAYELNNKDVAFIGINQVRDKIGSYFGGYETPGGHAWKHLTSVRIFLGKAGEITQGGNSVGIDVKFTIRKNKVSAPFRSSTFPLMFESGIDEIKDLVQFSEVLGVLQKGGPFYKFEGETIGRGLVNTMEALESNKELLDKVKERCYNLINKVKIEEGDIDESEQ